MKYEIKKNTIDDYTLIYTNKDGKEVKKDFKRTVEMAENLQGINARARIKMSLYLSKMGIKKDDLIIKTNIGNGKINYDESNYRILESEFIEEESISSANDLIEKCFGLNILDLFKDMGVNIDETQQISVEEQNQITLFTQKFMTIIKGGEDKEQTPSDNAKENN